MTRKLTYEYVYNYFKDNRCELLEKKYINSQTKMMYKCSCGNISKITFNSFKKGRKCKKCGSERGASKQRLKYEDVKNIFKNEGCILLEERYKNHGQKLKYKCSCGNISKISFNSFKGGQRCMKCRGIEKLSFEYVYNYFKKQGCELLEKEYKNNRNKMKYKCECGNVSKICFSSFQQGCRCKKCGGSEKLTLKYVYNYFKERECELLEKEYKNNRNKMKYKCECGNVSKICFSCFQQGRRCKKCGYEKRSGKSHWNYNINLTDEDRQDRRLVDGYIQWMKNIYKKYNYTCQKCFQRGGKLNAHHIYNYLSHKKLRIDISNGICFCEKCHIEFHKKYGKKNNNQEQIDKFLLVKY